MDLSTIADVANIVLAISVIVAITQININRKQLHLSTIERCISEFRKLETDPDLIKDADLIRYIELVNEELFYFQHHYLPKVIAYEWLDGMLDFVPIVDRNNNILNPSHCIPLFSINRQLVLKNYPRLKETFVIGQTFDPAIIYNEDFDKQILRAATRRVIVQELYLNVTAFAF